MLKLSRCLLLVITLGLTTGAAAQVGRPTPSTLDLQDGDTLVFAGDSITHQCLYTQYVENFFYTRYPDRRINFHNSGIGGDRAVDVLNRFGFDVAAFKPKYVTVLLGMNDGGYQGMEKDLFATYERDMQTLLDKINGIGAEAVVMSPTMFDQQQFLVNKKDPSYRFGKTERSPYYNSIMAFYGSWLREQAMQRGLGYVNMWAPLNDLTIAQRREDPAFTFVKDAIHPDEPGQAIMAFAILWDMTPDRRNVSALTATRNGRKWRVTAGQTGQVSDVKGDGEKLSFTFRARSLPWVLPEEAALGYEVTKAGHRLSNERLRVAGLTPGRYEVRIDGRSIGKPYTHVQLGAKIELQSNPDTPQYQQAKRVAELNKERTANAVKPYRDLVRKFKGALRKNPDRP
ncbi:MAG: SGNH/GDSL hydrolase family protein, partial [Planctomycetota bacterium]